MTVPRYGSGRQYEGEHSQRHPEGSRLNQVGGRGRGGALIKREREERGNKETNWKSRDQKNQEELVAKMVRLYRNQRHGKGKPSP